MLDEGRDWRDDWPLVGDLAHLFGDTAAWVRDAPPSEVALELLKAAGILAVCWLWAVALS